jgi:5-methylcytosine-specific restriction endonuclease McrA
MPYKPKSVNRPWIKQVDYNSMQGQGRHTINPFYKSRQWKRLRYSFIHGISTHLIEGNHANAICIECWKEGIVTKTHTIDHIKPINQSNAYNTMNGLYGEPLEWDNLQPLCEHHNAIKTGKERTNKL